VTERLYCEALVGRKRVPSWLRYDTILRLRVYSDKFNPMHLERHVMMVVKWYGYTRDERLFVGLFCPSPLPDLLQVMVIARGDSMPVMLPDHYIFVIKEGTALSELRACTEAAWKDVTVFYGETVRICHVGEVQNIPTRVELLAGS